MKGFLVAASVLLICIPAGAQSLSEIAKKEKERRKKNAEHGVQTKDYSEDEIFREDPEIKTEDSLDEDSSSLDTGSPESSSESSERSGDVTEPGNSSERNSSEARENPAIAAARIKAKYQPQYEKKKAELQGAKELWAACDLDNRHDELPGLSLVPTTPAYKGTTDCKLLPQVLTQLERELDDIVRAFENECKAEMIPAKYRTLE